MTTKRDLEKIQKTQFVKEKQEREREELAVAQTQEDCINQVVIELDSKLPTRQYLEVLRDRIAPKQKINQWGPKNGRLGYSLIYGVKTRIIRIKESYTEYVGGYSSKGGSFQGYPKTHYIERPRVIRDVFSVVLNSKGVAHIWDRQVANSDYYEYESRINPLDWGDFDYEITHRQYPNYGLDALAAERVTGRRLSREPEIWKERDKNSFLINTEPGLQELAEALTNFYVGLKTGQGK